MSALKQHGRLPWPTPGDLDSSARAVYDSIAGGPRATGPAVFRFTDDEGRLEGPFNAMVLAPSVGLALQELGSAIRYRSGLDPRIREVAILCLAAHRRDDFEAYAHEAVGRTVGLTDLELATLRAGTAPPTLSETEHMVHRLCERLLNERTVPDELYRKAVDALGLAGVLEIVTLVGYYDTLALIMSVALTPLPSGVSAPFAEEESA